MPTAMDIDVRSAGEDSNPIDIVAEPPQADATHSSPSINRITAQLPADGSGDQRYPMPVKLPSSVAVTNSAAEPQVEGIGSKEMVVYGPTPMEAEPPASQQSNPHIEDSERRALITNERAFQEFNLLKSNLFEAWERDCKDGDIL